MKRQWYYRGSLRFCNYSCSYCPFSKGIYSKRKIEEDKEAFFRFTDRMITAKNGGAVQVVPYGEALIYPHYWEGLAVLSKSFRIDAVGAQSNFSFPAEQMLALYKRNGGDVQKLRLWGTFHPEMTTAEAFAQQCRLLEKQNISYCVGAVGVPKQIPEIRRLRAMLPQSVYLWINKMDGLKRPYTKEEISAITEIDEFFWQELKHHRADIAKCGDNRFVEADGTLRRCNISRQIIGNFYEDFAFGMTKEKMPVCKKKECSCYLAYCNRKDELFPFFGPYPAFRIPAYPKASFFDIDGTLVPKGEMRISDEMARRLIHLANRCEIYLATSLPLLAAKRKLAPVWHVIRGGVFANGGRWRVWGGGASECLDVVVPMDTGWLDAVRLQREKHGFSLHVYRKGADVYKVTLAFRRGRKGELSEQKRQEVAGDLKIPDSCQILWEDNCMQMTKKGTGKLAGILEICKEMGYQKEDVAVFGDSENDKDMLEYFSGSMYQ